MIRNVIEKDGSVSDLFILKYLTQRRKGARTLISFFAPLHLCVFALSSFLGVYQQVCNTTKKIAASMHVEALKKGRSFRRLRGGLCLTLYYRTSPKDDIVLKLSRPKVQPSDTEVKVCVINFFGNCKTTNCVQKGYAIYVAVARSSFYGKAA